LQLLDEHDRVWTLLPTGPGTLGEERLRTTLTRHALVVHELRGARHALVAHASPARASNAPDLASTTFSEGEISLSAAHLLINGRLWDAAEGPVALRPGDQLDLSLIWHASGPTERELTVFVHLIDGNGTLAAQHDGQPAQGRCPTTTWAPGEPVIDRHTLVVPSASNGWEGYLQVGLYDSATVERLPASDGRDAIRLYEVRLLVE
jgi:hypothetical protein